MGLVVVDMQNDFVHQQGYFARHRTRMMEQIGCDPAAIEAAIPFVERLLRAFRDAHRFVGHTRMIRDRDAANGVHTLKRVPPLTYSVVVGPDDSEDPPMTPGTWGAEILESLAPATGEPVITKRTGSAFYGTDLEILLRRHKISTVVLAGTLSHACVLHTAFDASVRDFDVLVAREACATWSASLSVPVMELVDLIVGRVATVDEIIGAMAGQAR